MTGTGGDGRCSVLATAAGEPLAGTAPRALSWLVLEQPGPYGFAALTESHLPEPVRESLGALPKDSGTTVLLARRVGRHADAHVASTRRRFWFAYVGPGSARMRSGTIDDAELLRPDLPEILASAARGVLPSWGEVTDEPLLLVCTNSRRDLCCALEGRPVAESLAADPAYADRVLEVSHLGGHRFAPTALLLPGGYAFGRLDATAARAVLDSADRRELGPLGHLRGRTSLSQPAQAAEIAVRSAVGLTGLEVLDVLHRTPGADVPAQDPGLRWEGDDGTADADVRHPDGRAWHVSLTRRTLPDPKPESCGKKAVATHVWVAGPVLEGPLWR